MMKILIVGGGNMGSMLAERILQAELTTPEQLIVLEKDKKRAEQLRKSGFVKVFSEASPKFKASDLIIFAVKPQDTSKVFSEIKPLIADNTIVVSIMAGVKISDLSEELDTGKVVRAMPNLPCKSGKGLIGYLSIGLNEGEQETIHTLLSSTGIALEVKNENKIDAVTAISGSGPAYVFYFMDAMIQAALQLGFNEKEAVEMVTQTFEGSLSLFKENNLSVREWINRVASKGGTTEAALSVFDQFDIKNNIGKGILKAESRSKELSQK